MPASEMRPSSGRSGSSRLGDTMKSASGDDAFYEECKGAYLSLMKTVGDRVLSKTDLYQLLTNAGRYPSREAMTSYWAESTDFITYTQFCQIMRSESTIDKSSAVSLFHQLDSKDEGLLSEEQLFSFLTQYGEKMSPSEMQAVIAEMSDCLRDGRYDYMKMSSKIIDLQQKTLEKYNIKAMENSRTRRGSVSSIVNEKTVKKLQSKLQPKNLAKWSKNALNGFFVFESGLLRSTAYKFTVMSSSSVFVCIEPRGIVHVDGMNGVDVLFLVLKESSDGNLGDVVTMSDNFDGQKFCLKHDFLPGTYVILPFTYSMDFQPRKSQPNRAQLVESGNITRECKSALETLFTLIDIDDDNAISRDELNLFEYFCSGETETLEDEDWTTVQDMWEVVDGCITEKGFHELNNMEALNDTEALWNSFEKMGFNNALQLDENCPFRLQVYCEKHDNLTISVEQRLLFSLKVVDEKLMKFAKKQSSTKLKQVENMSIATLKCSGQVGVIAAENSGKSIAKVKLDLSKCSNIKLNADFKTLVVQGNSSKVAQLCIAKDPTREIVIKMAAEIKD